MNDDYNPDLQTKFNAGLDVAMQIQQIIKNCENYARMQRFDLWFDELKILRRRLAYKEKGSEKARNELDNAYNSNVEALNKYLRRNQNNRKISYHLMNAVYEYLSNYETKLRYWVDKFGYGMPERDDPRFAL